MSRRKYAYKLGESNLAAEYRAKSPGQTSVEKKKAWWKL
jgi:hypothetical protein